MDDRISTSSGGLRHFEMPGSDIQLTGYLKKMKTMKKKYFVLRSTSSSGPARLEYHDSEKKYNAGLPPKRVIHLHTCFNINRKSDSRHKYAIALYTKEECFSVVCEDEKEQERWLTLMLEYQNEFVSEGDRGREHYDFVWQVTVQPKGLGQTMNIRGPYRLCMSGFNLYLFKVNMDKPQYVFQLQTVRSVGHDDNTFKMIVGKIAPTGEGELVMHSDDNVIVKNIHETVLSCMRAMRQDSSDSRRTYSESLHGSASSLPRPPPEFRHRSETFTQGSNRTRPKMERPMSVCTRTTRSTSHLHSAVSPGSSPHIHGFMEHPIMGSHRFRSNSSDSKPSRPSISAPTDDLMHDHHSFALRPALQEEPDVDFTLDQDDSYSLASPGNLQLDYEEDEGQGGESYMEMINPGTANPPASSSTGYIRMAPTTSSYVDMAPSNTGYMDMAPGTHKGADMKEGQSDQGSTYIPMTSTRCCSAPIPIHPGHGEHGYMDMTSHNVLPPVKEGGSNEGYVPMSPPFNPSSFGSDVSQLKPDRVKCMLSDDGSDFSQPPLRTYSLGSRPVKSGKALNSGYVDMSGGDNVSDNGRSCSAPHLVHPHHHRSGRSSNMDSPTPSASPLSMSLKSDDSDAFMELDFYRPRTASDSYSYRPRASSFGVNQSSLAQGHRPRSSSHGQGTRPLRRHKMLAECMGRLNHEAVLRSQNTSQSSLDSLKVSSSESLKKLSQEVRTKTSQLNNLGYMDMSGEKRLTPSPQPSSVSGSRSDHEGYVDMTLGKHEGYVDMAVGSHRSPVGFKYPINKATSGEKSRDSDVPNTSLGIPSTIRDLLYVNFDSSDGAGKKESLSHSSPSENAEAYIMYEPAVSVHSSSAGGKENVPDSSSSIPKDRSGSGKEGKKRGGFFSLRHGQSDSGKHGSKKSESTQQSSGVLYSTTGGQQFGSLGRDFRKKSKELSRAARQKSSSFSKTFGISVSKPGKLLRKSPTPPSSLDGNDEYIEFCPTAAKCDSDSSPSSSSIKMTRARPDAIPAREEVAYVGFESGNSFASSSTSRPQVSSIPVTSGYLPMDVGGGSQTKTFTVIKPIKRSGAKRSKSREESGPVMIAHGANCLSASTFGQTADVQVTTASPPPFGQLQPGSSAPPHLSSTDSTPTVVKPAPVWPDQSQSVVCPNEDSVLKSVPPCSQQSLSSGSLPTIQQQVTDTVSVLCPPQCSISPVTTVSSSVCLADNHRQTVVHSLTGSCVKLCSAPQYSVSECPVCVQSCTAVCQTAPSSAPSCSFPPPSLSNSIPSHQPSVPVPLLSNLAPVPVDGGYMRFDPAQSEVQLTGATVGVSLPEVLPTVVRSCIPSVPSDCGPLGLMVNKSSCQEDTSQTLLSGSSEVQQLAGNSSDMRGSGTENNRSRRRSGGKTSSAGTKLMGESSRLVCKQSSSEKLCAEVSGNTGLGITGCESSCAVAGGETPEVSNPCEPPVSTRDPGVLILDSMPCMASGDRPVTSSRGRGRHNSSSSVGAAHTHTGKSSGSNSSMAGLGPGLVPINTGSHTRHSIADLSGCQQMTFPSNALSRQQPYNTQGLPAQHHRSGSTSSSQGGLNYAKLDLSSADSLGDSGDGVLSPRNRSRHSSAADEKILPVSYATIDFEKSEGLRSSGKDVKLIL
ncbi:uncharacterized protein LOC143291183 isoform X2 [Babylonia areolata]|uniref:uncharacterized protein LOC143291183 isoform X2 n=1 Tax=Babylonia areolata TaxID=304850 RepID=UPI003FD0F802